MTDKTLAEISKKMNILIALNIRILIGDKNLINNGKRKQGVGYLARYLANFGLDSKDVSEILGAPVQSVRTLLTPKRRK